MGFIDVKTTAQFSSTGPSKASLHDTKDYATMIMGLSAGQTIPPHPGPQGVFYVVEGEGWLTWNGERREAKPGIAMVVQQGDQRGIEARTDMVVLVSHARHEH